MAPVLLADILGLTQWRNLLFRIFEMIGSKFCSNKITGKGMAISVITYTIVSFIRTLVHPTA